MKKRILLYLITNRLAFLRSPDIQYDDLPRLQLEVIGKAVRAGCQLIQIREKDMSAKELAAFTRAAIECARPHGARVLVNDHRIATFEQMVSMMKQISPDNEVSLKVKRGNEIKILKAKLTSAPPAEPEQQFVTFNSKLDAIEKELNALPPTDPNRAHLENRKDAWRKLVNGLVDGIWNQAPLDVRLRVLYGFEVQTLTGQLMSYFAVDNGLLVSNVNENTVAARAGLQPGDVIVESGAKSINKLADLIDALDSAGGSPLEITVVRRRERLKITFRR
jgi:hypothetical protein